MLPTMQSKLGFAKGVGILLADLRSKTWKTNSRVIEAISIKYDSFGPK